MTPLERLGLEVCAFTLLGSRAKAALLMALLDAKGRVCRWEALATARSWRIIPDDDDVATRRSTAVRIRVLREALEDLGLGGLIKTCGQEAVTEPAAGYALPEPGRSAVIARLISEAS